MSTSRELYKLKLKYLLSIYRNGRLNRSKYKDIDGIFANSVAKSNKHCCDDLPAYDERGCLRPDPGSVKPVDIYFAAIEQNDQEAIKILLQEKAVDINATHFNVTALNYAICQNKVEIVSFLLDKKADVNNYMEEKSGRATALEAAIAQNSTAIVSKLLEKGAEVEEYDGNNPPNMLQKAIAASKEVGKGRGLDESRAIGKLIQKAYNKNKEQKEKAVKEVRSVLGQEKSTTSRWVDFQNLFSKAPDKKAQEVNPILPKDLLGIICDYITPKGGGLK